MTARPWTTWSTTARLLDAGGLSRFRHLHRFPQSARPLARRSGHPVRGPSFPLVHLLFVVAETYSWFLHRMGEEAARGFRQFLLQLPELALLPGTLELHEGTLRTLDRFRGAKLTYVDASSLSLLEQQAIPRVWAPIDTSVSREGSSSPKDPWAGGRPRYERPSRRRTWRSSGRPDQGKRSSAEAGLAPAVSISSIPPSARRRARRPVGTRAPATFR
jgi:hypothetical protein